MITVENALGSGGVVASGGEEGKVAKEVEAKVAPARKWAFLKKVANLERRAIPSPLLLLPPSSGCHH